MTTKTNDSKLVGYYVPVDLLARFRAAAKAKNQKMSTIVAELIREWVDKQGK
jgi:hypothetical protein